MQGVFLISIFPFSLNGGVERSPRSAGLLKPGRRKADFRSNDLLPRPSAAFLRLICMPARFSSLFLKCMKHTNRIAKLSDINYSPLAQNVDTDFVHAWADSLHWLPIVWFEFALNRTELETCGTASFIGEVPKIIKA
jgi:hypothetical protein